MPTDDDGRIRRPQPTRTAPIRDAAALLRRPPEPAPDAAVPPSSDDPVARSVELGYQVVDAYLRRGQDAARRVAAGEYGARALATDASDLGSRVVHLVSELAGVWGQLFELTGNGKRTEPAVPEAAADHVPAPATAEAVEPLRLRVHVEGPQLVEVSLHLRRVAPTLVVPALRRGGSDGTRLAGAMLVRAADGVLTLALAVPAALPAGTYDGPVVDEAANCPIGWLTVSVVGPPA